MEVQYPPNPEEEPNLIYKLQRTIKVFNASSLPNRGYNLVCTASKVGIVFIASPERTLLVYYLKDLIDKGCGDPLHLTLPLQESPTHISISCDEELLAVTGGNILNIYKTVYFQNTNVSPSASISCDVQTSFVSSLQWNPCIPDVIAIAYFDGTLIVVSVNNNQVRKIQSKARCICWSPKGKQLVVGNNDGTICQYKPDLSPMKLVHPPNIFNSAPVEAIAIHWISTYQFAVVFKNATDNSKPSVTIVNTPKGGQPVCLSYEDICYSTGTTRPWYYYLLGLAQWNLIIASSSNSMEIATLGSIDGTNWKQWCQMEEGRPELPLSDKKEDNYPVGLCIDTCAIHRLAWVENETLPHMPLLLVVSDTGVLTIFNIINLNKAAPQICSAPQAFVLPAAAMNSNAPREKVPQPAPTSVSAPVQPVAAVRQAPPPSQQPVPSYSLPTSTPKPSPLAPSAVTAQAQPQAAAEIKTQSEATQQLTSSHAQPQITAPMTPPKQTFPNVAASPELTAQILREDQERAAIKANKELTGILIKEVNEFQMELYNFMKRSDQVHLQAFKDLSVMEAIPDLQETTPQRLKQECSLEELKSAVMQLKLELVRACSVVAEVTTQTDSEIQEWSQPDPLTAKRLESIKSLVYYIENQLEQANKALDYKWNETHGDNNDKSIPRMIRPILDEVYQPLVKQQEILNRQEAVLKTLRATLGQCDAIPSWKATTLLRSTPFRKNPMSKLTKNMLNMSVESPNAGNAKTSIAGGLSANKLEALRDMLSNHKTVRIKPVSIELRQHFAAMRLNYEKSLREKTAQDKIKKEAAMPPVSTVPANAAIKQEVQVRPQPAKPRVKEEVTENVAPVIPKVPPTMVPKVTSQASVARVLFTDEPEAQPKPAPPVVVKPQATTVHIPQATTVHIPQATTVHVPQATTVHVPQATTVPIKQSTSVPVPQTTPGPVPQATTVPANQATTVSVPKAMPVPVPTTLAAASTNARSVLKDILQNKTNKAEAKSDENYFMGQKICSPTSPIATNKPLFSISPFQATNKLTFGSTLNSNDNKLNANTSNSKSDETGEAEAPKDIKQLGKSTVVTLVKKEQKSETVVFPTPNVPDVLKSTSNASTFGGVDIKNNVEVKQPQKPAEPKAEEITARAQAVADKIKKEELGITPLVIPSPGLTSSDKSLRSPDKVEQSKPSSPSELFASANVSSPGAKSQSIFASPASPNTGSTSIFGSPTASVTLTSSIFKATPQVEDKKASPIVEATIATTSVDKPSGNSQAASIFAAANSQAYGVTSTTSPQLSPGTAPTGGSIFASAAAQPFNSTPPANQSIFGSPTATTQPSVFSTPAPASSPSSIFGTATVTTQSSLFGSPTFSSQTSIFGTPPRTTSPAPVTPTAATQASVFGTPSPTNQASIFDTAKASPQTTSIFGSPTPVTQASIFGTKQSSSFGAAVDLFASTSISSTNDSQTNPGNIFKSGNTSPGSIFGSGSSSVFGQPTTATNVFGGTSTFGQQNQANNFWGASSNNNTSAFGASFGQPFSSPANQGSAFGNPEPAPSSVFGTPQQQSAFGGSSAFGSQPGFGQPAAFGGPAFSSFSSLNKSPSSGFGAAASFGVSAGFASSPGFGNTSPGKLFSNSPGFAQSTQSNATFESLATQNTVGFGNLAQQSGQQTEQKSSFNTSPSFTGWRG